MDDAARGFLHDFPALCLFLSLLLGSLIGRFHVKGVGFGSVVGTLIAGIVVGIVAEARAAGSAALGVLLSVPVRDRLLGRPAVLREPEEGCRAADRAGAGRRRQRSRHRDWRHGDLRLRRGSGGGAAVGRHDQSAALGTGVSAIAELPIADAAKTTLIADAPLADAITYGFGDLGLILFLTWLGPKIMRADLKSEAKALEQQLSGGKSGGQVFSAAHYSLRAYAVESAAAAASTLSALEDRYAAERLSAHRVERAASC